MKNTLLLLLLYCSLQTAATNNPAAKDTTPNTSAELYAKAKRQTTVGKILLFGGAAIGAPAVIIVVIHSFRAFLGSNSPINDKEGRLVKALLGTGMVLLFASIPFAMAGLRNRRKAKRLSMAFKTEYYNNLSTGFAKSYYPAVGIRIPL